ncbi:MAG TPA: glycosyltransferase family 2 protein [Acidimicrobiia bacterium]|nr:glycosyltransferase family 2 protein [Acidimicrobiia bacterium]
MSMSDESLLVSIVSPVYQEEAGIEEFHRRLAATLDGIPGLRFEIVFVNDGSTDGSLEVLREIVAKDPRARVVDLSRNFGHQVALSAGVDHARGDAVVVIDSDLQDPPEVIPEMVERWRKGFKVVYGVRTSRSGETRFKLFTSNVYYGLIDRISEVPLPRQAGDFRLLDRAVVDVLARMPERNRYVRGMVAWVGFPQSAVEYERDPRYAGETKYTLRRMVRLGLDGLTSFSERPLRLATQLGLVVTVLAFLLGAWVIVATIADLGDDGRGWPSLMAVVLFLGGVQLLCIGVLGEYLGRVYRETKGRPLYVVGDVIGGDAPHGSGAP